MGFLAIFDDIYIEGMSDMSYGRIMPYSCKLDKIQRFKAFNYAIKSALIAHARHICEQVRVSSGNQPYQTYIPSYRLNQWLHEMKARVLGVLDRSERAVVCIGGASASGKGVAADNLIKAMKLSGKRVFVLSTDAYYKGISRMIIEKLPDKFGDLKLDKEGLISFTRDLIENNAFADKLSDEVLAKIGHHLSVKYPGIDANEILSKLKNEFAHINFDSPDAVNLTDISAAIDRLKAGETVSVPEYSMKTSEPAGIRQIKGSDYDVIIIEGIYGLNGQISGNADIKTFIEADYKTLLMRRLRRDVLGGRCSFTSETALWIALEIVLPSYFHNILQDRGYADLVLLNSFTGQETFDTQSYDVQERISISRTDIPRINTLLGAPIKEVAQEDYYFTCNGYDTMDENILRVRVENGVIVSFIHKGKAIKRRDAKIVRPVEEYVKGSEFGEKYPDINKIIASFNNAGFYLKKKVQKVRKLYILDGIEVALDVFPGGGHILEFRVNNDISKDIEIDKIKKKRNIGIIGKDKQGDDSGDVTISRLYCA